MKGGNLFDFVMRNRKSQNQRDLSDFAPRVAKELLSGLKHIHSDNLVHRDLKPKNVFLAEDVLDLARDSLKIIISDFGIARLPGEKRTETGMALIVWFTLARPPKPGAATPERNESAALGPTRGFEYY
ncbi:hypothetical protein M407DRAFT_24406 [Tulasnella calospora MUT 4182]|uniref:Protein kinase domain-containing protein n=1 Tax=Tulasnella calospora MUT 4182 TaxID=1051891 RepID=A0A0C3Q8V6_9AGAM|nr:hypothetical protein M407DRAFT_24406 [Tulasnella calospora MUT 4182]